MSCHTCNITGVKLSLCSGCKTVRYCSIHCQKQDWSTHKNICRSAAFKSALAEISRDSLFVETIKLVSRTEIGLVHVVNSHPCKYSFSKISSVRAVQICEQNGALEIANFIRSDNSGDILVLFTDCKGMVSSINYKR